MNLASNPLCARADKAIPSSSWSTRMSSRAWLSRSSADREATSRPLWMTVTLSRICSTSLQEMAGDDHRCAALALFENQLAQIGHALRVETVARLVEHQEVGLARYGESDRQALPHALRVAADLRISRALEAQTAQRAADISSRGRRSAGREKHREILRTGQPRLEGRPFDGHTDPADQ